MKKYFWFVFAVSLIAPLQTKAADTHTQKILQNIIDKLDVTSFANSVRPRREDNKVTFKDYDIAEVKFGDEKAIVRNSESHLQYVITLLDSKQSKICFEDQDMETIPYHTRNAYVLKSDISGFLKASMIEDPKCPAIETSNSIIEKATGLSIKRIDEQGQELPMNDAEPGSHIVVTYQGKTITEDSAVIYFQSLYLLHDEKVVLLAGGPAGLGCPLGYSLISIHDGAAHVSESFGRCNAPDETKTTKNELIFTFYTGYGLRDVYRYKDHKLSDGEEIKLPLKVHVKEADGFRYLKKNADRDDVKGVPLDSNLAPTLLKLYGTGDEEIKSPSKADGFRYLKKYADKDDVENILLDSKLNPMLLKLFGTNFDGLQSEIGNGRQFGDRFGKLHARTTDDFIILSGKWMNGVSDAAIVMIGLDGHQLYAATLNTDDRVKPPLQAIRAYSNQPTRHAIPTELKQWIANLKSSDVHWKYAN